MTTIKKYQRKKKPDDFMIQDMEQTNNLLLTSGK